MTSDVTEFGFHAESIESALMVVMKLAEVHDVYALSATPCAGGNYDVRFESNALLSCVRTAITDIREGLIMDNIRAERSLDVLSPETMLDSVRELGLDEYAVRA